MADVCSQALGFEAPLFVLARKILRGAIGAIRVAQRGNNCFATGGGGWILPEIAATREDNGFSFLVSFITRK